MVKYADLKQVSSFSTAYVTVIRFLASSTALTLSVLPAVYKAVGQAEIPLSTALVVPLWNISTSALPFFS
jgi:hypothetical protein